MMDFWTHHGWIVLVCLALFPRLTLLLGAFVSGGFWWWLGWVFAPHLLVAFLAIPFWASNPVLVVLAWVMALSGSSGEASVASEVEAGRKGSSDGKNDPLVLLSNNPAVEASLESVVAGAKTRTRLRLAWDAEESKPALGARQTTRSLETSRQGGQAAERAR